MISVFIHSRPFLVAGRIPRQFRRGAGGCQTDRGDAGGGAGGDDLGGRFVAEAVVGDESDAERPAFEELDIAAEPLAERGQVRQGRLAEPQDLEVAEVVGLGADEQVVLQVGVDGPGRRGRARPSAAVGKAAGVAGRSRSM